MGMRPSDRVLLTSLAGPARLRELAEAVTEGALVGLGSPDEVWQARRLCADLDHVMFVQGCREEIPWADAWFDVIVDTAPHQPTAEMQRVLKAGGRIIRAGEGSP